MDDINVKSAKTLLLRDLEDYPLVLHDPIGDARTYLKIKQYVFTCITEKVNVADCKDWLYKLYEEQTEVEKSVFIPKVDLLVNALYDFYSFLQNNKIV
jgi:hypothetical protein